ncbi:MAG: GNAT family N-acetyltransferase [Hyphomicrobiales bacterium]
MSLEIRPVIQGDEKDWRSLWRGYLEYYETSVPEEVYQTTFSRLIDPDHKTQQGLLAVKDGKAIGLVHYIYHAHNWRLEDVCYLQDLYTDPTVRGTGAGRALIEAVYKAADENGTPSVYWMTQDFNQTARHLYDRVATLTPFIKYQR